MCRLYMIGNGFDLHHGIPSSYKDFRQYVEENEWSLANDLEEYFDYEELWSDFEESLAHIDMDLIVENADDLLVGYGADDWSDSYHHDYPEAIQDEVSKVSVQLIKHFQKWIHTLEVPQKGALPLDKSAQYLSFNYTKTLQDTYGIPDSNIVHIHGKTESENSELVLGHSYNFKEEESKNRPDLVFDKETGTTFLKTIRIEKVRGKMVRKEYLEEYDPCDDIDGDPRVEQGKEIIQHYFQKTFKNSSRIIEEHQDFFSNLKAINHVFVLGHSLAPVDMAYLKEVVTNISDQAEWSVSYYDETAKNKHFHVLTHDLNIAEDLITQLTLNEL